MHGLEDPWIGGWSLVLALTACMKQRGVQHLQAFDKQLDTRLRDYEVLLSLTLPGRYWRFCPLLDSMHEGIP